MGAGVERAEWFLAVLMAVPQICVQAYIVLGEQQLAGLQAAVICVGAAQLCTTVYKRLHYRLTGAGASSRVFVILSIAASVAMRVLHVALWAYVFGAFTAVNIVVEFLLLFALFGLFRRRKGLGLWRPSRLPLLNLCCFAPLVSKRRFSVLQQSILFALSFGYRLAGLAWVVVRLLLHADTTPLLPALFWGAVAVSAAELGLCIPHLLVVRSVRQLQNTLHAACRSGAVEEVVRVLERGASVDARHDDGSTPLIAAAAAGFDVIVTVLLSSGAGLELQDDAGRTALMHACIARRVSCVQLLLEAGAGCLTTDDSGTDGESVCHCIKSARFLLSSHRLSIVRVIDLFVGLTHCSFHRGRRFSGPAI